MGRNVHHDLRHTLECAKWNGCPGDIDCHRRGHRERKYHLLNKATIDGAALPTTCVSVLNRPRLSRMLLWASDCCCARAAAAVSCADSIAICASIKDFAAGSVIADFACCSELRCTVRFVIVESSRLDIFHFSFVGLTGSKWVIPPKKKWQHR